MLNLLLQLINLGRPSSSSQHSNVWVAELLYAIVDVDLKLEHAAVSKSASNVTVLLDLLEEASVA